MNSNFKLQVNPKQLTIENIPTLEQVLINQNSSLNGPYVVHDSTTCQPYLRVYSDVGNAFLKIANTMSYLNGEYGRIALGFAYLVRQRGGNGILDFGNMLSMCWNDKTIQIPDLTSLTTEKLTSDEIESLKVEAHSLGRLYLEPNDFGFRLRIYESNYITGRIKTITISKLHLTGDYKKIVLDLAKYIQCAGANGILVFDKLLDEYLISNYNVTTGSSLFVFDK